MKHLFEIKNEKITEKAFTQCLTISVLAILLCVVSLCSATYAWFNGGVSSDQNTLVAGTFQIQSLSVRPLDDSGTVTGEELATFDAAEPSWTCTITQAGNYRVTVWPDTSSTAKGRCTVTVNETTTFHTVPIIGDGTVDTSSYEPTKPLTFDIYVGENMEIDIAFLWGIALNPDIQNNATYDLQVTAEGVSLKDHAATVDNPTEENTTEENTTEENTPEETTAEENAAG